MRRRVTPAASSSVGRWTVSLAIALAATLAVVARPSDAAVFSWHDGATLHLTNDADAAPTDGRARRFENARHHVSTSEGASGVVASGPPVQSMSPAPVMPVAASRAPRVATQKAAYLPPIVVAPTIVVRMPETRVTVVRETVAPSWPWIGAWDVGGFSGHEHPQVGFLAGRRLVPHSHFFGRGRRGTFTAWGHFTVDGLLIPSVPY